MNNEFDNRLAEKPPANTLTPGGRVKSDPGRRLLVRYFMQVLWPAFLGAAMTTGVLFSVLDPLQIEWVHVHLHDSREAAYTAGFIVFWAIYMLACSITWFLATTEVPDIRRR